MVKPYFHCLILKRKFSSVFPNSAISSGFIKIIIIIHNSFDKKLLWLPLYYLCKISYKYSDEIITVSEELSNNLLKSINKKNIKTIYNPFDFEKINIIKNEKIENNIEKIFNNWKINFCNIARLSSNKKQDLIIDYFYEYYKNNKNIQLFFIWEWDKKYKNIITKKINYYWLNNSIFFLWHKNNVYKYLNKMNYFLFASKNEWFWRTLIDSLACNIPILSHDYNYWAKEIIRNNNNLSKCEKIEIHTNWILTPYMDKESFIKWMELITKTNFDKIKIKSNIKKYNIENFNKNWKLILK